MKITIKTIKGEQFQIDIESTDTILDVKGKVATERPDFSVERQKLIHSGKVLKDGTTVAESGFKENDFLVCMVTKEVPKPASRAATASTSAAAATDTATATSTAAATANTPATSTTQATSAAPPTPPVEISEDSIAMLTAMGFPDAEARYALTAARGDGNLAVEFLMNGVPEQLSNAPAPSATGAPTSAGSTAPTTAAGADGPLAQLRLHPQFTQLQRLVQSNPAALGQVLEAIGQQDQALLATIHANHDAFVAMMNEPIVEQPANPAVGATGAAPPAMGGMPGAGGMPDVNPAQLIQMLAGLTEEQRGQAAASMGMTMEQLQQFTAALSSIPSDQLQNMMGSMGGPGVPGNAQVISLTQEELAAVRRIQDLGFSEQQAVQAFIACDRNETLAANMLFDGGLGFDEDDGEGGDDMYN